MPSAKRHVTFLHVTHITSLRSFSPSPKLQPSNLIRFSIITTISSQLHPPSTSECYHNAQCFVPPAASLRQCALCQSAHLSSADSRAPKEPSRAIPIMLSTGRGRLWKIMLLLPAVSCYAVRSRKIKGTEPVTRWCWLTCLCTDLWRKLSI